MKRALVALAAGLVAWFVIATVLNWLLRPGVTGYVTASGTNSPRGTTCPFWAPDPAGVGRCVGRTAVCSSAGGVSPRTPDRA